MSAAEVIARELLHQCCEGDADAILDALKAAGFAVVATEDVRNAVKMVSPTGTEFREHAQAVARLLAATEAS